ncbi:MAG: thioredoxin domain-containing protein [Thermodesulfobacteriota bacterium]
MNSPTPNRLIHEKSPYLLQHAENPVDWYPWGEEAFDRARRDDRPVFLSVGYSTCHWCHVMAHESFEDEAVAALLNDAFVCVKVDREERPDIDGIYMRFCQMMTGGGGWPLTVIMTPGKRPFFAATYIPKESRWGRTGLVELIPRIRNLWETRRGEVERAAAKTVAVATQHRSEPGDLDPTALCDRAFEELQGQFDETHGGFGDAQKFPMPHQLLFLLRHGRRTGAPEALRMAEGTLAAMRRGGIFDHLGYGFHRYSTDRRWLVPHFEKMLYDQALLAMTYTEAFQATGNEGHARTVRETLDYVLGDLRAPEGGFFSAEDADSEGEEGRFYLWRMEELRGLLGSEELRLAAAAFSPADGGNFVDPVDPERRGDNILHLSGPPAAIAEGLGLTETVFLQRLEKVRLRLLAARGKRVRPQRDDKILTDWNGLMIAALARASRVLDEPRYMEAARAAIRFVRSRLRTTEGRLLHRFCKGEAAVTAGLDDHAFLIWGLIEAYEAGFDVEDLREALALQGIVDQHFRDPDGGYFFTPDDGEQLLFRMKEGYDGAVPSGNAVTLMNLIRLGRLTGDPGRDAAAAALGRAFAGSLRQAPSAHAQWMTALELLASPTREVVVAGRPGGEDTLAMLAALRRAYLPNLALLFRPDGVDDPPIAEIAPFTREMRAVKGRAAAYVCTGFACRRPVTDPRELEALLDEQIN